MPVYENELPEQFQVPSLYIPPPYAFDENDTVSTFKKTYSLNVKLFHADSVQALYAADRIADAVRESRQLIPLLTESGRIPVISSASAVSKQESETKARQ